MKTLKCVLIGIGVISAVGSSAVLYADAQDSGKSEGEKKDSSIQAKNEEARNFKKLRDDVANVSIAALPTYLGKIQKDRIGDFGFQSEKELAEAEVLSPIPMFYPDRDPNSVNREYIEKSINVRPVSWLVPVSVKKRIVCLIHIESTAGKGPEVVMFGDNYRANRLESGLSRIGMPDKKQWENLRFLSLYEPTVDLLLFQKNGKGPWKWLNLKGTQDTSAELLDDDKVDGLLEMIRNLKPAQ